MTGKERVYPQWGWGGPRQDSSLGQVLGFLPQQHGSPRFLAIEMSLLEITDHPDKWGCIDHPRV